MLKLKNINFKFNSTWKSLLDLTKPIGYIYISLTSEDPSQLYGGNWSQITNNTSNPGLLSNTTSNLGTFTSGSYNYTFTPAWNQSTTAALTAAQIGRKTSNITLGNATLNHLHVNWTPGNSSNYVGGAPKRLCGATAAQKIMLTKGNSSGGYKCVAGRKSDQLMLNNTTQSATMSHKHARVDTYYKTNTTYNGSHSHSLKKNADGDALDSVSFTNKIPRYTKIYIWKRVS